MPVNEIKEASWDSKLKQTLINYYRSLVEIELNEPIPLHSSFLGIKTSKLMTYDLSSSNPLIPSVGPHGVFEDGIPFYHYHIQTLVDDEKRRLEECGVRLKTGKFTVTEDEQIRKNWLDYCEISGADFDEVVYYMGVSPDRNKKKGSKYFRAFMCLGMPDRSGIQIYRRCQSLYHPSNEEGGAKRPWTKDELQLISQLGHTNKWADIGIRLNRPRAYCYNAYLRMVQSGIITGDDENDEINLVYKHVTKAIGKDLVSAIIENKLDVLEQNIDWNKIGELISKGPKDCRKLYKKIKQDMEEVKSNTEDDLKTRIKAIRKKLPKTCRKLSRLQTKKVPRIKLSPKEFSRHVKALCTIHEEELKLLKKPYRLSKMLIASEALSDYDERGRRSVLRRLNYILTMFEMRGVFDFLPIKNRDLLTKLRTIAYVSKKSKSAKMVTSRVVELAKRFIEKQGWEPTRLVHAHKLPQEKSN